LKFEVTILGSGSATPTLERNPTSQYIYVNERHFLIDCGEGTQMQLRRNKIRFQKISHIFISHLHGDHYLGLVGLISSLHLLGRTNELHVFGPAPLKELVFSHLKASKTFLKYPLFIREVNTQEPQILHDDKVVKITSFPLKHRIPCMGFRIDEKPKEPNIKKEAIDEYGLGVEQIKLIKEGKNITLSNGKILLNDLLTEPPSPPRSYAFCSDTAFAPEIVPYIENVTALYHEATFLSNMEQRAKDTYHSTAPQAAIIAQKANVGALYIGHISARYKDAEPLLLEAKTLFSNTMLTSDNMQFQIV
jgi:ribonuclease Z